jgi:hypothetical protein
MSRRYEQKHLLHNWSNCRCRDRPQSARIVLACLAHALRVPEAIRVTRVRIATIANIARSREGHAAFANIDRGFSSAGSKYWEVVADKLSAAGWSWGYCSAVTWKRT